MIKGKLSQQNIRLGCSLSTIKIHILKLTKNSCTNLLKVLGIQYSKEYSNKVNAQSRKIYIENNSKIPILTFSCPIFSME
jgi:Txe/YoeB family toxin of Txe-Axe toxin-antitoxin module